MNLTISLKHSFENGIYTVIMASYNLSRLFEGISRIKISLSATCQMCFMGLWSDKCGDHFNTENSNVAFFLSALFCWRWFTVVIGELHYRGRLRHLIDLFLLPEVSMYAKKIFSYHYTNTTRLNKTACLAPTTMLRPKIKISFFHIKWNEIQQSVMF